MGANTPFTPITPMLCRLADEPFDREGWVFEIKWDGYRAIAETRKNGEVFLYSRKQQRFNHLYPAIVENLAELKRDAVLDGEIVVLDRHGKANFQALQNWGTIKDPGLTFFVFDLLLLDGKDLTAIPLVKRKTALSRLLKKPLPHVRFCDHVLTRGKDFFAAAQSAGVEGIVAKNGASSYFAGRRTPEWIKIKKRPTQDVVVGGFTEPRRSRTGIGALLLGVYEDGKLVHVGHAGTGQGFNEKALRAIRKKLEPLEQDDKPFANSVPKQDTAVHWVRPVLVCEVTFTEWTDGNHLRQASFVGWRPDKAPWEAVREVPKPASDLAGQAEKTDRRPVGFFGTEPPRESKAENLRVNGRVVRLSRPEKVLWPEEGYTKRDLVTYYSRMAVFILPYLKDRPLTLHRHPNGIRGPSFFQTDVNVEQLRLPAWIQTTKIRNFGDRPEIDCVMCQDEATLLFLANLACIEFNPWNARHATLEHADYVSLDLDPLNVDFKAVIETALATREVVRSHGEECFCKTSGGRGLHVLIPLAHGEYSHDQAKQLAEIIATLVHARLPKTTSLERMPAKRDGRVYLDYMQNGRGKTLVAPYSVRPRPGAGVSAPLTWDEVAAVKPERFTLKTMPDRVRRAGDLWRPLLKSGIRIEQFLARYPY